MAKIYDACVDSNKEDCLKLNKNIAVLHEQLFLESNPIPTKWALYKMGLISDEIRMPLTKLSVDYQKLLEQTMKELQLI
jgi:4-hydroxy-tetrahydrodipicolinate synthase